MQRIASIRRSLGMAIAAVASPTLTPTLTYSVGSSDVCQAAARYTHILHRTHISLHPGAERSQFREDLITPIGAYELEIHPDGLVVTDSSCTRTEVEWDDVFGWREVEDVIVVVDNERRGVLVPTSHLDEDHVEVLRDELEAHCRRR